VNTTGASESEQPRQAARAAWLAECERHLRTGRHVLLHGNVRDLVLFDGNFLPLAGVLDELLRQLGFTLRFRYNLADGLRPVEKTMADRLSFIPRRSGPVPAPDAETGAWHRGVDNVDDALRMARDILAMSRREPASIVFEYLDKLFVGGEHQDADERARMVLMNHAITDALPHTNDSYEGAARNAVVCVAPHLGQVPAWLYRDQPLLHTINVTRPDERERGQFFDAYFGKFFGAKEATLESLREAFTGLTEGMSHWDLEALRRTSHVLKIPIAEVWKLVDRFKHGTVRDPWEERRGLTSLDDAASFLSRAVIGQVKAVAAVESVVTRARGGIHVDGIAAGARRPKGVLFFVGPTGVGKTELA
jgi:hypothetical protein